MKTVTLRPELVWRGCLILVNAAHPYHEDERSLSLEQVGEYKGVLLERRANTLLSRLMAELNAWQGIAPVSGWRSLKEQQKIWDDAMAEQGKGFTEKYVAKPGHSEHQSGLAVDLGVNGRISF